MSPRWRKLLNDARAARGRLMLMAIALAASGTGLTTMLSAYGVLNREVSRNYLGTHPASAQLVLERSDDSLAKDVARWPGVADAQASSTARTRVFLSNGAAFPLLLFVATDWARNRINVPRLVSGAWPASGGSIALERSAVPLAQAGLGDSIEVRGPQRAMLNIVGIVHDPALAPASMEQTIYAYATPAVLRAIGSDPDLHILKVVTSTPPDRTSIETAARAVARRLEVSGRHVEEIRVPPPGLHPHQSLMMTLLVMLLAFAAIGFLLGCVLSAAVLGEFLAQQRRDIAIMKAVGAGTSAIGSLYLALVGVVAVSATAAAILSGALLARAWVQASARLLNLEIERYTMPGAFLAATAAAGILVPLATALVPVITESRRTIRETLGEFGVSRSVVVANGLERLAAKLSLIGAAPALGIRNAFRRQGRLVLSVLLIGAAGAVFIACASLKSAWFTTMAASSRARHYDLELNLERPASESTVQAALTSLQGLDKVEAWPSSSVSVDPGDHIALSRVYPDEGHGRTTVRQVPPGTHLIDVDLLSGRWLREDDTEAIVVNSAARAGAFSGFSLGDTVALLIHGHPVRVKLIGIVREIMTPAMVYSTREVFDAAGFEPGSTNAVRIALKDRARAGAAAREAIRSLEAAGIAVRGVTTEITFERMQSGHIGVLVLALGFIALIMAITGALGLASTLGSNLTERIRELGVLKAIGARAADIRAMVSWEAAVYGVLGAACAVPASLPLLLVVGRIVGRVSAEPLVLALALPPVAIWFAAAVMGSVLIGIYPAVRAARLTVRESLSVI